MTSAESKEPSRVSEPVRSGGSEIQATVLSVREAERRTLPPSEWDRELPRSAASVALERFELDAPVARRSGPRAELASALSRLNAASRSANEHEERIAAAALARGLSARGTELDAATRYARRALLLGDEPALREELSSWFAGLGEPLLSAATLRPLLASRTGLDAAALALKIGTLLARGGDAHAARELLLLAARENPADPVSVEQLASLSAWSAGQVSVEEAAHAYLDAAERREALGERPAAFENLMRAWEMAPQFAPAVERLALALTSRGRVGAADEVRREHARALPEQTRSIHLRRLRDALRDGDLARAVGAAFDARLDAELDLKSLLQAIEQRSEQSESVAGFDELLERVGMHELFAARLEIGCDLLAGRERARARLAQARLFAGPLGRSERALECWIDALVVWPGAVEAKEALRSHALATRDYGPLIEALIRVGESKASGQLEERSSCLRELLTLAEERLGDAGLASWAHARLAPSAPDDSGLRDIGLRLAAALEHEESALEHARQQLESAQGEQRLEPLSRLAGILQGRPEQADEYLAALAELRALVPEERAYHSAAERVLQRQGRMQELEVLLSNALETSSSDLERARLRLALSGVRRRRRDLDGALRELAPLMDEAGVTPAAACMTLLLSAQRGQDALRARSLWHLAGGLSPSLRAVLGSVAAEALLEAGEIERARAAAEQACHADPSLARPVASRARVGLAIGDRQGIEALERAMGVIVPRAALCGELADAYERLGEPILALAWTQRRIALRPGDALAARARLVRMRAAGDGSRLADTLAWLLSLHQPLSELSSEIAEALRELAQTEPMRAGALARRALEVLGPRHAKLREAVLSVADAVGERGLGIAVLERWLSAGSPGAARPELLLELSRRRRAANDADGAARALLRAIREGASPSEVLRELDSALPTRSSDGDLALLEARAECLSAHPEADVSGTALAFRTLGAALHDLAGDSEGALCAWERAMALDLESGPERFAADVTAFIGPEAAVRRLKALAQTRQEPAQAARLLAVAAGVALASGKPRETFELAERALELDATRTDVLALAERTAGEDEASTLDQIYERLATATLGCYGERAVQYRAARQFERRRDPERALRHAIAAFLAVPSEGLSYVTMARLAEHSQRRDDVVRALERVAQERSSPELRAAWLKRAALFAGPSEEGKRQRVDVLLRALSFRGDAELLDSLSDAIRELLEIAAEEREVLQIRFSRAIDSLLARVDGPDGARLGIAAADIALVTFDDSELALTALERAQACDGDLDEYARLLSRAPELARAEGAAEWVARLLESASQRWSGIGTSLIELGSRLAAELGDYRAEAALLVAAARKTPENYELVRRAEGRARALGDPQLIEAILEAVPPAERGRALLEMAAAATASQQAEDILRRAAAVEDLPDELQAEVFERLAEIYRAQARHEELEQHLASGLDRLGLEPSRQAKVAAELSALIGARGEPERAIHVMQRAIAETPSNESLWSDLVALARQARDRMTEIEALTHWVDLCSDPRQRLGLLRELSALYEQAGDDEAALERWSQVLELDGNDVQAIAALERKAERQSDYEMLVRLLARRASLASMVDEVRRIRLRRAAVLEQRLGRPDEARAELEALVTATGDNLSVLRVLADLNERLGAALRAAPLWLRASALAQDRGEAADLSRRACEAYLTGGDVEAARRVLESLGAWARSERLLELGVEVERRRQNPQSLAEALDELATVSSSSAEHRAELLVEAARASLAAGDREAALSQAMRAARIAPDAPEPQLVARYLEYMVRGSASSAEEARIAATELRALRGDLTPDQSDLRAFLTAEALDRALGGGAGLRELERVRAELGDTPLVALATAERVAESDPEQALALFERALTADLRSLRSPSSVALQAARTAAALGDAERALALLDPAFGDPDTREAALELSGELSNARARLRSAPPGERRLSSKPPGASDPERGRYSERPNLRAEPPRSEALASDTLPLHALARKSGRESPLPPPPRRSPLPVEESLPVPSAPPPSPRGSPAGRGFGAPRPKITGRYSLAPEEAEERVSVLPPQALLPAERGPTPVLEALESRRPPELGSGYASDYSELERGLYAALRGGSLEAGLELVSKWEGVPTRVRDFVSVARRVALLAPGDREAVERLHRALLADRDAVSARAAAHVLAVLDGGEAEEPPPLSEQPEQPEAVRALLFKEQASRVLEALSLVWEGAEHVFRRDPSTYGVTGLERVPLAAPTPLARAYAALARCLGLLRTPLFQRRSAGPVTVSLALLSPPAVILSGDVRQESPELRFHLAAMLAAATPQFALLFGSPESQGRAVLRGLSFAFGPPRANAGSLGAVLNLAEVLWESIPARLQRRLRELCEDQTLLDYDAALLAAKLAVRRAGLFGAGDLGAALQQVAIEEEYPLGAEGRLVADFVRAHATARNLYGLSLSAEYAHARWHAVRGAPRTS
jgi:hypothetical protein